MDTPAGLPSRHQAAAVRAGEDGLSALSRCILCIEPELSPAPKPLVVAPESAYRTLAPLGLREQPGQWTGASRCHGAPPPDGFSAPRAGSVHTQPPSPGSRLPSPSSASSRHGSRPRCFPDSSESVRSVRIRLTTLARLLHGLDLLPSGISSKMIIFLDAITIIAMLDVSFLSHVLRPTTCMSSLPNCHEKPLTPPHPRNTLFGYVIACSALLIALLVAGAMFSWANMDIYF